MAANHQDLKGYDHQFAGNTPDNLFCLICLCVARDPQQINCCGKLLCRQCLEDHKKHSNNCPHCRKSITSFADKKSQIEILSLKTRCDNSSNGCKWVKELRLLNEHLGKCDFTLLPCPNECHKSGNKSTVVQLLRKDIEKHKKECPRRQYECPHCKKTGEYQERTTKHLKECTMIEVPCPKDGCNIHIPRCHLSKHSKKCQFETVCCKYSTIGCKKEILRKDLREHEGDTKKHLQLAVDTVHQQQIIIKKQENMLAHLRSRDLPMTYKFTEYDNYKMADDGVYSPAFYTSLGGYKMCIGVFANGIAGGQGTHVTVGSYLMKGENDDHLPWPFTGTVTVELLNQLEDKNHHSKTITFPSDNEANQRPVDKETTPSGYGSPYYISHSNLGYKAAKNCQYLKDDCLYFRISVDAKESSKPWLLYVSSN